MHAEVYARSSDESGGDQRVADEEHSQAVSPNVHGDHQRDRDEERDGGDRVAARKRQAGNDIEVRNQVVGELLELLRRNMISALVVGWHGKLATGRAEILKRLLPELEVPVLLVRPEAPGPFRLKFGEEFG